MKDVKNTIPLYKFDEHNEAFYYWHKAKSDGYLNNPLDLFHVDAHSDMSLPKPFRHPVYLPPSCSKKDYLRYYRNFSSKELGIDSFIAPAILNGFIKNVYFIYPGWRKTKQRMHRNKISVGSAFGEGKIMKSGIKIETSANPELAHKALPDLKYFGYYTCTVDKTPTNRKVILDIDLDYFACRDSVANNYRYELEISPEQYVNRKSFLRAPTLRFTSLHVRFTKKNGRHYATIAFKKAADASYLPAKEEIETEIDALISTLKNKKIYPVIITMCRSKISGFCPAEYQDFLENRLEKKLADSFGLTIDTEQSA